MPSSSGKSRAVLFRLPKATVSTPWSSKLGSILNSWKVSGARLIGSLCHKGVLRGTPTRQTPAKVPEGLLSAALNLMRR